MPLKRLIAGIVVKDGWVVQSLGFSRYLPVGRVEIAARFFNAWGADEILLIDIDASREGRLIDPQLVERVAREITLPLTVGGGVRSLDHMRILLNAGADKILLNRALIEGPQIITNGASRYGAQCIVASIDARQVDGDYRVFIDGGRAATGLRPEDLAKTVEARGAGEVLLNSIDRDGSRRGFDLDLAQRVSCAVSVPVICMGGASQPRHFLQLLQLGSVSAAAAANCLHFTEHSIVVIKAFLRRHGIALRIDTQAEYTHAVFDGDGRLAKRDEAELAAQVFEYIGEDII